MTAFFALALVTWLWVVASESAALGFLATPNPSNPDRHNQESKPIAQPPDIPSPSRPFGNSPTPKLQQNSNERQPNLEKALNYFEKAFDDPLAALTVILIGILIWHAYLFKGTLNVARDTAQRQLRAYVHIHRWKPEGDPKTQTPTAVILFKNYGQTPAYHVRAWMGTAVTKYPVPPEVRLRRPDAHARFSKAILAPDNIDMLRSTIDDVASLPKERRQLIGTADETLYLYGEIRYVDAFGKRHWTTYRYIFGGPWKDMWSVDVDGNEADQDP